MNFCKILSVVIGLIFAMESVPVCANVSGKTYETITQNLVCNFEADPLGEKFSWLLSKENGSRAEVAAEESGNQSLSLSVPVVGGSVFVAKNFRCMPNPMVCEFQVNPAKNTGVLEIFLYNRGSFSYNILAIKGMDICVGETKIGQCLPKQYTKISVIVNYSGKYDIYIAGQKAKSGNPFCTPRDFSKITGIKMKLTATEESTVLLDNIYCYPGTSVMDEYSLLSDSGKAAYRTKNAVAFVSGYAKAYVNGAPLAMEAEVNSPIKTGNTFYVPALFVAQSLGLSAIASTSSVTVEKDSVRYEFTAGQKTIHIDGTEKNMHTEALHGTNDVLVDANVFADLLGLQVYDDKEDLMILSTNPTIYQSDDDTPLLTGLLKTAISGMVYRFDSLNRRVKIFSEPEIYHKQKLPIVAVTSDYEPQPENAAVNIADGDLATRYSADGSLNYVQFDFGEIQSVGSFAASWMNGNVRKNIYVLSYSEDGINWTTMPEARSTGTTSFYEAVDLNIRARYIRYYGHGTIANDSGTNGLWNSISEMIFYKEEA